MDTDNLLLSIVTERDVFELLSQPSIAQHLDQSVYADGHPLKNDAIKGKIGTFKNESKLGQQIQEYVGLRAKMYAYRYSSIAEGEEQQQSLRPTLKAKVIKSSYVRKHLRFETYTSTLLNDDFTPEPTLK